MHGIQLSSYNISNLGVKIEIDKSYRLSIGIEFLGPAREPPVLSMRNTFVARDLWRHGEYHAPAAKMSNRILNNVQMTHQ
jgi:hypothetical protein